MPEDSVFTKIIKGEIPSHKVYEDNLTIAFIPLHPIALGHVLVVPKKQVDKFYDLPDEDYKAVMDTVKKVAKHMEEVLQPRRVGLKVEGLDVPHAHVHVIAFDNVGQFHEAERVNDPVDTQKLADMAKRLAF